MSTITPNMNLIESTVNVDNGLAWETNLNSSLTIIDGHNHTSGYGVQIPPAGLNINAALPFNNNPATSVQSIVFQAQSSLSTLGAIYSIGADLYYNDTAGNVIRITSGGTVNATSSGISNGSATASFVSSVLVVNAAANTPANIQGGSLLLGNNLASSKFLTLSPPSAMGANYSLTLPTIPGSTSFVTLDTSGNLAGSISTSAGIIGSNISSNINLPGKVVQEQGLNVVVSNTNAATNSLAIVRGVFTPPSTISAGEGFSVSILGTGLYQINFTTSFLDLPAATANATTAGLTCAYSSVGSSGFQVLFRDNTNTNTNTGFSFIAIGQRA